MTEYPFGFFCWYFSFISWGHYIHFNIMKVLVKTSHSYTCNSGNGIIHFAAAYFVGSCTPEKTSAVTLGTTDNSSSPQVHHQITITANNISTVTDGRSVLRRNSFKRSSSWALDPKKILFLFATL